MNYFLVISCVVCGWAMLRVIGSERSHLIQDLEARARKAAEKPPPKPEEPLSVGGPAPAPAPKSAPKLDQKPAPAPVAPAQKAKH